VEQRLQQQQGRLRPFVTVSKSLGRRPPRSAPGLFR
jgi:hypothetical protein